MKNIVILVLSLTTSVGLYSFITQNEKQSVSATDKNEIRLGAFSMSLSVKNLEKSKDFYESLGFHILGGKMEQKYLIMKNENTLIGLFEGMFEGNILTFNPGWDEDGKNKDTFDDIRVIEKHLIDAGISIEGEKIKNAEGPASMMFKDPDGNLILIDQHR